MPGWQDVQSRHVLSEELRLLAASAAQSMPVAAGTLQQRVVDIGHVLDVIHLDSAVAPHTDREVERRM